MDELTVVVPTYNGSRFLAATLSSLQRQATAVEVVVVDDGSSDDSVKIASEHEVGARVISRRNAGVAVARNVGLLEARTSYVAFLDQDDLWHQRRSSTLLELFHKTGAVAVATTEQSFAVEEDRVRLVAIADGRELWPAHWIQEGREEDLLLIDPGGDNSVEEISLERLMQAPATVTTAIAYERAAAITAGGFAPFIRAADDHLLNINLVRIFGPIPRINRPELLYRVHSDSATRSSPLVAPYLTTLLALRHGRILPPRPILSEYVEHLLLQLATSGSLSRSEQLALMMMTVPPADRLKWTLRWLKRTIRSRRIVSQHNSS